VVELGSKRIWGNIVSGVDAVLSTCPDCAGPKEIDQTRCYTCFAEYMVALGGKGVDEVNEAEESK